MSEHEVVGPRQRRAQHPIGAPSRLWGSRSVAAVGWARGVSRQALEPGGEWVSRAEMSA